MHQRSWAFAALLASLAMLGPFAVDMYLPAFPDIGSEFGASQIALQQTLSAYLFAFAFMMLWHGALSDSLGRRPIVLAGLLVFALGSLGCAIAGNVQVVVAVPRTAGPVGGHRNWWLAARSSATASAEQKRSA